MKREALTNTNYKITNMSKKILLIPILLMASVHLYGQCSVQTTTVNATCFGMCDGSATATPTGQAPFAYLWVPGGQTTQAVTGLCAGSYTVQVTDANNCTAQASVTITQPPQMTVNFNNVINNLCNGECNGSATANVSGGTPAYTYMWNTTPAQFTATATGLCAGTYTFVATDANGCTVSGSVTITQPALLAASVTSGTASCNICNGSATVNPTGGTGPYTYQWTPTNQTTQSATGLCPGAYTVIVTDANGCTVANTVTVTSTTPITVTSTQTNVTCSGDCNATAMAMPNGGTAPYTYLWSNGQMTQTATGLCAGSYTVTVTDANGCTSNAVIIINQPAPLIVTTSSTTESCLNCCDATATINPSGGTSPYFYNWSPSGQTTQTSTGLCSGTYTVCVTDANGCTTCDTVIIPMFVGLQEWTAAHPVQIYPNPFSKKLEIGTTFTGEMNVLLYDLSGRTVHREALRDKKEMDLGHLEPGIYFIHIVSEAGYWRSKLVRQ
jgi:hypothetical protein